MPSSSRLRWLRRLRRLCCRRLHALCSCKLEVVIAIEAVFPIDAHVILMLPVLSVEVLLQVEVDRPVLRYIPILAAGVEDVRLELYERTRNRQSGRSDTFDIEFATNRRRMQAGELAVGIKPTFRSDKVSHLCWIFDVRRF